MVEFKHFGWNALTVALIGTIIFGFNQAVGFVDQGNKVWGSRNGASVSALRYLGLFTYGIVITIVGWVQGKLALVIDGALLFPVAAFILLGLREKRGMAKYEYALLATGVMIATATPLAGDKQFWFYCASTYSYMLSLEQPILIALYKDAGEVSWKGLRNNGINLVFWNAYAYAVREPVLMTMTKFYNVCCLLTIALWFKYRRREKS